MDPTRAGGKHPFEYQRPNAEQVERIEKVRQGCKALYDTLLENVQSSRERSLALTKLEEVSMWANKAIVFEP
jgi:hypothetical protein